MIRVNQHVIEESTILTEMQYHPAPDVNRAKQHAIQCLIIGELISQRLNFLGISVDKDIESALDSSRIDNASVLALLEQEVIIPDATDADCLRYFTQNNDKFCSSPLFVIRHILMAKDRKHFEDAKTVTPLWIIEQLQNGADFSTLAQKYSLCTSANIGGQLGQISQGQTCKEFEEQVFTYPVGLVPRPIETRYGIHIVIIDEKQEGVPLPFEMVKSEIADYLEQYAQTLAYKQYISYLINNAEIEGYQFEMA